MSRRVIKIMIPIIASEFHVLIFHPPTKQFRVTSKTERELRGWKRFSGSFLCSFVTDIKFFEREEQQRWIVAGMRHEC